MTWRIGSIAIAAACVLAASSGCRTIAAAADPMNAPDCRVFVKGAGNGQVVVDGLDAYATSIGIRRHLASLQGKRLLFDTPLGGRQTGTFDGRMVTINVGLTTVKSGPIEQGSLTLEGSRYKKRFAFNSKCSPGQAAVGAYALFELNRRRQRY